VGRIEPAHHVHAHAVGRLVELDHIAGGFVHRRAVFSQQQPVGKVLQEGRPPLHDGGHRQETVEPVAKLPREGLADPVCREPFVPILAVAAIAQRGIGHDAGIKPGVAHVRDARHLRPTLRAADLDGIDIGTVRRVARKNIPTGHRTRF